MQFLLKSFALPLALTAIVAPNIVSAQDSANRIVLVLPFDNRSGNASLNWIGDSFPDTLDQRLNSAGFLTISHDDRAYALDHLGLPVGFKPSRATTIRIAQQLDAGYVVVGSYNIANNKISVQAQVLNVAELRLSAPLGDGADLPRLFDAENAIAWKVARQIDPRFNVAEQTFLASPGAVPLPAFENYIRGTNAVAAPDRLSHLQTAVKVSPAYASALLALGKEQYAARDFVSSAATLSKIPPGSKVALEGNFYLGLARFNSAQYAQAENAFSFVAARLPLPEVVNNEGVAASRQGKDAVPLFQRASTADPNDEDYHFNLAVALFRRGDIAAAIKEADAALKLKPADSEASELRARLNLATAGTRLTASPTGFSPVERVRRTYSETGFRQAAFQMEQMRTLRMSTLPLAEQVAQYTQIGTEYLGQGLVPQAEQQFQSAIAIDGTSAAAHSGLAQVREQSGDPAGARTEALTALKYHENINAYLVLARLDLQQNLLPDSADNAGRALRLEPRNAAGLAVKAALQARGQSIP